MRREGIRRALEGDSPTANDSGLGGLWFLIKILLVIFAITACYTANLVRDDPDQLIVAVIIWVVVIAGIIVFFMAVSYWGGKNPPPTPYSPVYQQSAYAQMAPGYNPYPAYAQLPPIIHSCRYCDSNLSPQSPICPRCGRKN